MNTKEHLLVCIMEELAEVQQAISKGLRFGLDDEYLGETNLSYIQKEFGDLSSLLEIFRESGIGEDLELLDEDLTPYCEEKIKKVEKWMEYSKKRGYLSE